MEPIQHLSGLALVTSGFFRILAACALFAVLARLTSSHRVRYALWLLFLIGAGLYWTTLLAQILEPQPFAAVASRWGVALAGVAGSNAPASLTIPFAWDSPLELASSVLVWVYLGGLLLMLFRLAQRRRSLRQALAKARPVSSILDSTFSEQCDRLGALRCQILELPGLCSPGVAYTWRPVLLIPEDLCGYLDGEQFIDILHHELIHVRRMDFLWAALADFVSCLLFFHPAVWLALRNLGRERELACDQAVVKLRHGRRTDYASCLTQLARRRVLGQQLDPPSHLALLNSFLAIRVRTLLAGNRRRSLAEQSAAATIGLLALLVFFAGWSSLSLGIELPRPVVRTPLLARREYLPVPSKTASRHMKLNGRSTESALPLTNLPAPSQVPVVPDLSSSQPAPDRDSSDVEALSPPPDAGRSQPEGPAPVWDEAPALNATPSLPSTIAGAAVDALGRIARGRRPDGDRDKD